MKRHIFVLIFLALPLGLLWNPLPVSAQTTKAAESSSNDDEKQLLKALLQEIRQLRLVLQHTQEVSLRTQVTLERVRLQQSQVDSASRTVESIRNRLNELSTVRPRVEEQIKGLQDLINDVVDPNRRAELETQMRDNKARLGILNRDEDHLRERDAEASSALQIAQAKLAELHTELDNLIREMEAQR